MFSEIERVYKKDLMQARFRSYYWPRAVLTVLIALMFNFGFHADAWLVYSLSSLALIAFVGIFFVVNFYKVAKATPEICKTRGIMQKLRKYHKADRDARLNGLIDNLRKYHIDTRAKLELTINFYEQRQTVKVRTKMLEWVLSAALALGSTVMIAYDETTGAIDLERLLTVLVPTLGTAFVLLSPVILALLIEVYIKNSRAHLDSGLVEDLAFIYVNFDQFEQKLQA